MKRILVIDDDIDTAILLCKFLLKNGFETDSAFTVQKAIDKCTEQFFDIVITDFRLGGKKDGKDILLDIKRISPQTIVLIMTGYSDLKIAVDVIKHGAYDYLVKPLIPSEVLGVINNALNHSEQEIQTGNVRYPIQDKKRGKEVFIDTTSEIVRKIYHDIELVAPTNYSVILYGESGTGKEVTAKQIHNKSIRKEKPFIAMDCGTLSKELAGSELFGHIKGSFTGAIADKAGLFELADGGTLFLDEVANLSAEVQASLLRIVQERKFKRIGGSKDITVDVRIIVASNENLFTAYKAGKFREDLYHRFNEFSISLPALRHRKEDIPLFAAFFLKLTNEELGKSVTSFEVGILDKFMDYKWPGNLREFRNVIRRAVLLTTTDNISAHTLPWEITNPAPVETNSIVDEPTTQTTPSFGIDPCLRHTTIIAEYEALMKVFEEEKFNKSRTARRLNIDRKTFYNKIRNYNELQQRIIGLNNNGDTSV